MRQSMAQQGWRLRGMRQRKTSSDVNRKAKRSRLGNAAQRALYKSATT